MTRYCDAVAPIWNKGFLPLLRDDFARFVTPKQLLARYKWAGTLAAFLIGAVLGSGALWSYLDYRNKSNVTALEQIKLEKEYYERLQIIQSEVLADLPKYIGLRDRHLSRDKSVAPDAKGYDVQNEYLALLSRLAASIERYNRLEWKLSNLEQRRARWLLVPVPAVAPENLRLKTEADGKQFLVADAPPEPLLTKVREDLKGIIDEIAQQQPTPATNSGVDWVGTLSSSNQQLVEGTEIRAEVGTSFGIRYTFTGRLTGRAIPHTVVYRFPATGIISGDGNETSTELRGICRTGVTCTAGWTFSDSRELVPGPWSIEIWEGNQRLTARTFQVTIK